MRTTVSVFGTNLGQSIAGAGQAERIASREKNADRTQAPAARRTRPDQPDEVVVSVELADAVKNLKGNNQEETREEHQERPAYGQDGASKDEPPKRIDVQG